MKKKILYSSFAFLLATVIITDNSLENRTISSKYFWFYAGIGLMCITTLFRSLSRKTFHFSIIDGFVFLFIFFAFYTIFVANDNLVFTTKISLFALISVLYFCLRSIFDCNIQQLKTLACYLIIFTGLIEAIWGMMQLYGHLLSQHYLFKLTGSFFNPGPYAGYLALVFPIALHFFLNHYSHPETTKLISLQETKDILINSLKSFTFKTFFFLLLPIAKMWLCGITSIAILLLLPATMSRASWLSIIAGSMVVIIGKQKVAKFFKRQFFNSKIKRLKVALLILAFSLLAASVGGLYYLKKDSADGRLLTWKVSMSVIKNYPWGVGLGNFSGAYGDAQAEYFASGKASSIEEYVAGNPEYGFNDFLQIAIELGIVSLFTFIGILICAFRGLFRSKHWGIMGSLVALLVFACFSYPFSVLPFLIVFVFLLAMSVPDEYSTQTTQIQQITADKKSVVIHSICVICVPLFFVFVTSFCFWKQLQVYNAHKQWNNNKMYYYKGMYKEAVQNYEILYPYLSNQIGFLFEYGRSLSMAEQQEKSNEVLKRATKISCDPMLYNIIGKNYQMMKEYDLAEKSFQKASLIVPNRIYPHYLLMKLYVETGEEEKAKAAAQIVLSKEPKVMSTAVKEMRKEAKIVNSRGDPCGRPNNYGDCGSNPQ